MEVNLTGAKRREWMGIGVAGMIITSELVIIPENSLRLAPVSNGFIALWLFNIAMENGPFIDDLPIKNGDFPWLC